jgi:2-keto-4-pentenoate hydratase/2-oxohepta-3-ene-1,7-dioic acid hydratase in catechol pathway
MKWTTINQSAVELAAVYTSNGLVTIDTINEVTGRKCPRGLFDIIAQEDLWDSLKNWYAGNGRGELEHMPAIALTDIVYAPLYRQPAKIWGIGMNYVKDAAELQEASTQEQPVGFMKPATTIIGPGESVVLPRDVGDITAEGELAIVIGKRCRNLTEKEARSVVAGFTTALDMTVSTIHAQNPRFLTRAKSYDTFLSIGPQLITPDEIADILELHVSTVHNGEIMHRNKINNMKFRPWSTVAFHSSFMTLLPGDLILTGTPGPVVIRNGDWIECRIDGFQALQNGVTEE